MKIEKGIAYWCETEELAKEFLQECKEQGWKWINGEIIDSAKLNYNLYQNQEKPCYILSYYCTIGYIGIELVDKTICVQTGRKIVEYKGKNKDYPTIISHIVKDNKVIIKLSNGNVGTSKCNAEDKFDIGIGTKLAVERAYEIDKEEEKGNKEKYIKVIDCDYHYERFNYAFNLSLKQQNFINSDIPQKNKIYKYIDKIKFYISNFYFIQDINTEQFFLILDRCCEFVDKPKEKEKFIPYLTYFHNYCGDTGEETDIVDILGNKLYVGDVVFVYRNGEKLVEQPICKKNNEKFVFRLKGQKWTNGCLFTNDDFKYQIIKSRNYEEIKNGEVVNGVRYTLEE